MVMPVPPTVDATGVPEGARQAPVPRRHGRERMTPGAEVVLVCGSGAAGRPPRGFVRGVRAADLRVGPPDPRPVTEADLAPLPRSVRRYLRFMGVCGRPRDRSVQAHFLG